MGAAIQPLLFFFLVLLMPGVSPHAELQLTANSVHQRTASPPKDSQLIPQVHRTAADFLSWGVTLLPQTIVLIFDSPREMPHLLAPDLLGLLWLTVIISQCSGPNGKEKPNGQKQPFHHKDQEVQDFQTGLGGASSKCPKRHHCELLESRRHWMRRRGGGLREPYVASLSSNDDDNNDDNVKMSIAQAGWCL